MNQKTVFIVNPMAGQGKNISKLIRTIEKASEKLGEKAEVYVTKAVGDAERFVREYCETFGSGRFIACGGDGTVNEVLNGAMGVDGAEVGVVPIGTGNDFCRNFQNGRFDDVLLQMTGESVRCDAIRYRTVIGEARKEGYCANMFNIGFDCHVADLTQDMKKKAFVSGSLAYFLSIFKVLWKKKCTALKIELDGKTRFDGELLLTSVANGSFCGGGIKSNPLASTDDGRININIIRNVSHLRLLTLLPFYMKGTFLKHPKISKYIESLKCHTVTVTPKNGHIRLCVDGEIMDAGKTEFEVLHHAFRFVLPLATASHETADFSGEAFGM